MSMTPENTATTWRDLADQLTPEQIAELKDSERGYNYRAVMPKSWWGTEPRSHAEITALMLHRAQLYAAHNLDASVSGGVPLPAGGVFGYIWEGDDPIRVVWGPHRGIIDAEVTVWTTAIQQADGRIAPEYPEPPQVHIETYWEDGLTSAQAREMAAVLLEAADELDAWAR
jgi:hypothetical protein